MIIVLMKVLSSGPATPSLQRWLNPDLDWLTPYLAKTARAMEVLAESDGEVYHVRL